MRPHAFIAMPFGIKPGPDGQPIDFNAIHLDLLAPALRDAGCEPMRADQEMAAGDIRTDMFQELLVADLVLVDLTLDNPNVWYELGVRHALRARGVVLVQGPRAGNPFDTYTDRRLTYHLADGRPDPAHLQADRQAIAEMVRDSLATGTRRKVSPVYKLLPHLRPPEWRSLMLDEANEWSDAHRAWRDRVTTARRKRRPGDILVLAGETPTRALRTEAQCEAGQALLQLGHHDFALEQFDAALAMYPDDMLALRQRVVCLARLGLFEDAQTAADSLTEQNPRDPEVWALAGAVACERWERRWREQLQAASGDANVAATPTDAAAAAADEDALLEAAIVPYRAAFLADARQHGAGVLAALLMALRRHLGATIDATELAQLDGGARWSCACALADSRSDNDFAALTSAALLALLDEPGPVLRRRFKTALAAAKGDWFMLESLQRWLVLLRDLNFRPEDSQAMLGLVARELAQARAPVRPRKVVLFSGHMMDTPDRASPRFPPALEAAAAREIEAELDRLGAGEHDLALSQGAAGGDLLFLEACQRRGMHIQMLLPFDEAAFLEASVRPSAFNPDQGDWCLRYYAVQAALRSPPRLMPDELGPGPHDANPFERCNLWLLYTGLAWGMARLHFICLWNGGGGDGPGGTAHMMDEVKRRTGRVKWIDTRRLAAAP